MAPLRLAPLASMPSALAYAQPLSSERLTKRVATGKMIMMAPGPGSPRERERERESFIRNNLHNGVVSGAARGQALRGPMWAGLTPDSKGDPTGDTGGLIAADRRHHTCLRDAREHCRPLQAARQVPGKKN